MGHSDNYAEDDGNDKQRHNQPQGYSTIAEERRSIHLLDYRHLHRLIDGVGVMNPGRVVDLLETVAPDAVMNIDGVSFDILRMPAVGVDRIVAVLNPDGIAVVRVLFREGRGVLRPAADHRQQDNTGDDQQEKPEGVDASRLVASVDVICRCGSHCG